MWPYWRSQPGTWGPLGELLSTADRLLGRALRPGAAGWRGSSNFPPVAITGTEEQLVVTAEIPGVILGDLDLSIPGDTLTIKGERCADETIPSASYHRRERLLGHFARSVTLPERVDAEGVTATYTDGVLRVVLPKAPEARTRKIDVGVT